MQPVLHLAYIFRHLERRKFLHHQFLAIYCANDAPAMPARLNVVEARCSELPWGRARQARRRSAPVGQSHKAKPCYERNKDALKAAGKRDKQRKENSTCHLHLQCLFKQQFHMSHRIGQQISTEKIEQNKGCHGAKCTEKKRARIFHNHINDQHPDTLGSLDRLPENSAVSLMERRTHRPTIISGMLARKGPAIPIRNAGHLKGMSISARMYPPPE